MHTYADDTTVSVSARNVEELEAKLNSSLAETSAWMKKNHLTVNCSEIKVMIFGTSHTLAIVNQSSLNVTLDGANIDIVKIPRGHSRPQAHFQ